MFESLRPDQIVERLSHLRVALLFLGIVTFRVASPFFIRLVQFLRPESIFGLTPGHFTGGKLMKRTVFGATVFAVAALSLSGCFEARGAEAEVAEAEGAEGR